MQTLLRLRRKPRAEAVAAALAPEHPAPLHRAFVETGDERCPLAGVWSPFSSDDAGADEPGLAWPAVAKTLLQRAFHPPLILLQ